MTDQNPNPEGESPFQIPDSAQEKVDDAIEAFSKEFDRRQANHPETAQQTREALIKGGIGRIALSAEEIEAREAAELEAGRRRAAEQDKKPAKKRRRHKKRSRDPKGGGPPPHIAKQLRKDLGLE